MQLEYSTHSQEPRHRFDYWHEVVCRHGIPADSVTEAAFAHGFSDAAHFSRAFRKAFGCTPRSLLAA
nr:helix-turn-helix domain-containing protein [Delftia acidovorans]